MMQAAGGGGRSRRQEQGQEQELGDFTLPTAPADCAWFLRSRNNSEQLALLLLRLLSRRLHAVFGCLFRREVQ